MSDLGVSLLLSLWISLAARHSLALHQMKSRQLYWLSGTFLGFEWEGRLQCARERFNLKSVQLTAEHSCCSSVCVCVCRVCKGDTNTQYNLIKSNFDSASTAHPFKHVSAGLPVMSSKVLKLYSRLQNWTSLLLKTHNAYTHTGRTQRARSGAVWGLWWNR